MFLADRYPVSPGHLFLVETLAKRFTDSEKWRDDWFFSLSNEMKLFWLYLLDNCDHAGFWKPTEGLLKACLGVSIDLPKALEAEFKGRVFVTASGKWFIPKFLKFQYPQGLSWHITPSRGVINRLREEKSLERVTEAFGKGYITLQDKDKDKDKEGGVGETKPAIPQVAKKCKPQWDMTVPELRKAGLM